MKNTAKQPMTKVQFANICIGTLVDNLSTSVRYRVRDRICRTLVLERVSPVASAPLIETPRIAQHADYSIVDLFAAFQSANAGKAQPVPTSEKSANNKEKGDAK